jgi:hypothetical protein
VGANSDYFGAGMLGIKVGRKNADYVYDGKRGINSFLHPKVLGRTLTTLRSFYNYSGHNGLARATELERSLLTLIRAAGGVYDF